MSFLAGRLAANEAAYFIQESKIAVNRLAEKIKSQQAAATTKLPPPPLDSTDLESQADVLSEVLKHSLPSKIFAQSYDPSTFTRTSKWALNSDPTVTRSTSPDKLNPLTAFVSFPQVTFGPKRWELPVQRQSALVSTANEMRKDRYESSINPEKLKAAAEGLANVGKAFAAATALVFGGAATMFALAVSKLEMHNSDDIRSKGKDLVRPKLEMIKEQVSPLRAWAEDTSKRWHLHREVNINEKHHIMKELSKTMGAKTSN